MHISGTEPLVSDPKPNNVVLIVDSRLLPDTWSHLWFKEVHECPPWCSIVGATVTVHQSFCFLH